MGNGAPPLAGRVGGAPAGTFGACDMGQVLVGDHLAGRAPTRRSGWLSVTQMSKSFLMIRAELPLLA
jgi:hypothetical protein